MIHVVWFYYYIARFSNSCNLHLAASRAIFLYFFIFRHCLLQAYLINHTTIRRYNSVCQYEMHMHKTIVQHVAYISDVAFEADPLAVTTRFDALSSDTVPAKKSLRVVWQQLPQCRRLVNMVSLIHRHTTNQRLHIHCLAVVARVLLLAPLVSLCVYIYMFFGSDIARLDPRNILVVPRITNSNMASVDTTMVFHREATWNYRHLGRGINVGQSKVGPRGMSRDDVNEENVLREPARELVDADLSTFTNRLTNVTTNGTQSVFKLIEFASSLNDPGKNVLMSSFPRSFGIIPSVHRRSPHVSFFAFLQAMSLLPAGLVSEIEAD